MSLCCCWSQLNGMDMNTVIGFFFALTAYMHIFHLFLKNKVWISGQRLYLAEGLKGSIVWHGARYTHHTILYLYIHIIHIYKSLLRSSTYKYMKYKLCDPFPHSKLSSEMKKYANRLYDSDSEKHNVHTPPHMRRYTAHEQQSLIASAIELLWCRSVEGGTLTAATHRSADTDADYGRYNY